LILHSLLNLETFRGKFYGLGADGTVGANKNSIKIIGESTDYFAQGYFVYDSKKSGSTTVSHLRFGPKEIKSTYLINKANFIACHQQVFLEKMDMLKDAVEGATFLIEYTKVPKDEVWDSLPEKVQKDLIEKKMKFFMQLMHTKLLMKPEWVQELILLCRHASLQFQNSSLKMKQSR
jgi:pyruvate-ferredoxin/flavodoxin oxidoreductase